LAGDAPWDEVEARALIEARRWEPGAMLPILHELQERYGYIDAVSFYHDFRREPLDATVLKICRAESCQALGCEDLVAYLSQAHGIEPDVHAKGTLAIETVYCLGHCALSPAALLDGEPIGRLDYARLDEIVAEAKGRPK
jgi:formate dehydrogenase subunit gamma